MEMNQSRKMITYNENGNKINTYLPRCTQTFLESPKAIDLSKYAAVIQKFYPDHFLLAKYGGDATILKLYNALEGPHLIGVIQIGPIAGCSINR